MIHNYQYFGFPNYINPAPINPYSNQFQNIPRHAYINTKTPNSNPKIVNNNKFNNQLYSTYSNFSDVKSFKISDDQALFSLFGISLHFDDILLICLIFFLYNEKINDNYLLLSLVLLLLS